MIEIVSTAVYTLKTPSPLSKISVAWRDPHTTSATSTSISQQEAEATSSSESFSSLEGYAVNVMHVV